MAREAVRLVLQRPAFEGLHKALERLRSTSKTVTVEREALTSLLIDYAALVHHYRIEG